METVIIYLGFILLAVSYLALTYHMLKKDTAKGFLCLLPLFSPFFFSTRSAQDKKLLLIALSGVLALACGTSLALAKQLEQHPSATLHSSFFELSNLISGELQQAKQKILPTYSNAKIHAFWQDNNLYLVRNISKQPPQMIKIHLPVQTLKNLELNILPTDKMPGTTVQISQASSIRGQGSQQLFTEGYTLGLKVIDSDQEILKGRLFLDLPGDFGEWQGDLVIANQFP